MAHRRYHCKRVLIVQPLQRCIIQMAELQAHESSAWLQHPIRLRQHPIDVRAITNAKCNCITIKRIIGERQLLRIGAHPIDGTGLIDIQTQPLGPLHANVQHILVDVRYGDVPLSLRQFGRRIRLTLVAHIIQVFDVAEGNVTGATGHVKQLCAWRRSQTFHECVLPDAVDPHGHRIVHDVIRIGHILEHFVN